jgi:hypothetical protein
MAKAKIIKENYSLHNFVTTNGDNVYENLLWSKVWYLKKLFSKLRILILNGCIG